MYRRILLKLSGETLQGENGFGIDEKKLNLLGKQISALKKLEIEIAIVIGAGNYWRYRDTQNLNLERNKADKLGMLATIFNCTVLAEKLKHSQLSAVVYSAFEIENLAYGFDAELAKEDLLTGEVVFLAGGTGNPFFTTDSAAVLRALELDCEVVLKATKVDGVYNKDPLKNKKAVKFDQLSYQTALEKNLQVMDQTAFSLAKENNLPIIVFNMFQEGNLERVVKGEGIGTLVN